MIVDAMEEVLKKTSSLPFPLPTTLLPSLTHSASHGLPTGTPTKIPGVPSVLPDPIDRQFVGHNGSTTLWVVFVLMVISSAVFAAWSWTLPVSKRLYHVITTLITITAAISYFAMATGQGVAVHHIKIRHSHKHVPDTYTDVQRQVFYARYIDWALTTPLLLLDLSLLAGLNGAHITMAIVADIIMILTGLFAAFGTEGTPQKWGWYAIACIAFLVIIWHLVVNGRAQANSKHASVATLFSSLAAFTIVIWTAYPIVWGFADGARHLSVDGEIIAYAVLDILAKPVFGIWLLATHARVPETNINLGGFWSNGLNREGTLRLGDDDGA